MLLGLTSCGLSNNKYSDACKKLEIECKTQIEFDAKVIRGSIGKEVEMFSRELDVLSEHLNKKISPFIKKSFNVDVVQYKPYRSSVSAEADRIIEGVSKVDSQKVFIDKVSYDSKANKLFNVFHTLDEIEVKNIDGNTQLSSYLKICSELPVGLCRISFYGEITAVKTDKNWKGWVTVKDFNSESITSSDLKNILHNQVALEVRRIVNSSSLENLGKDSIKNFVNDKLQQLSK